MRIHLSSHFYKEIFYQKEGDGGRDENPHPRPLSRGERGEWAGNLTQDKKFGIILVLIHSNQNFKFPTKGHVYMQLSYPNSGLH